VTPALLPLPDPTHARRLELAADGFLSVAAAAAWLSVSESEVYEMCGRGELAWAKLRKRRLVSRRSLVEYMAPLVVVAEVPS